VPSTFARAGRLLGLASLGLLTLTPSVCAAELDLRADFDGDGQYDRVLLDRHEPSLIRVWLSKTGCTAFVRTPMPVSAIVASDLDGDHKAELVTRGATTGLQIWTKGRKGFHRFRARTGRGGAVDHSHRHSTDDAPGPLVPDLPAHTFRALFLVPHVGPRAPEQGVIWVAGADTTAPDLAVHHGPSAPRPPPPVSRF